MAYQVTVMENTRELKKDSNVQSEEIKNDEEKVQASQDPSFYISGLTKEDKNFLKAVQYEMDKILDSKLENSKEQIQIGLEDLLEREKEINNARKNIPSSINMNQSPNSKNVKFDISKDESGSFKYEMNQGFSRTFDGLVISLSDLEPGNSIYEKDAKALNIKYPNIDEQIVSKANELTRTRTLRKIFPTKGNKTKFQSLNEELEKLNRKKEEIAKADEKLSTFNGVMESREQVSKYLTEVNSYDERLAIVQDFQKDIDEKLAESRDQDVELALLNGIKNGEFSSKEVKKFTKKVLDNDIFLVTEAEVPEDEKERLEFDSVKDAFEGLDSYISMKQEEHLEHKKDEVSSSHELTDKRDEFLRLEAINTEKDIELSGLKNKSNPNKDESEIAEE